MVSIVISVVSSADRSRSPILSFRSGSCSQRLRVALSSAACGSAGAATLVGSCAVTSSWTMVPDCARKPTMIAGASVVPMERISDSVASAELESRWSVRSSIM